MSGPFCYCCHFVTDKVNWSILAKDGESWRNKFQQILGNRSLDTPSKMLGMCDWLSDWLKVAWDIKGGQAPNAPRQLSQGGGSTIDNVQERHGQRYGHRRLAPGAASHRFPRHCGMLRPEASAGLVHPGELSILFVWLDEIATSFVIEPGCGRALPRHRELGR